MSATLLGTVVILAGATLSVQGEVHDREALLAQLGESRALISSASVAFTVWRAEPEVIPVQSFVAIWGSEGFRVESLTQAGDPEGWVDEATLTFDSATGLGVHFIAGRHATMSSTPQFASERSLSDYFALLGYFPTVELAIGDSISNDAIALISHPDSTILDGFTSVSGYDCIIVERSLDGSPVGTGSRIVGAYAPAIGLAQVELQIIGPDGASTWRSNEFVNIGDAPLHLPAGGIYVRHAADGTVIFQRAISIDSDVDGAPAVTLHVTPQVTQALPAGTTVVNLDTGETWMVAAATGDGCMAGGLDDAPVGRLALAGAGLLALAGLGAVRRFRSSAS